MQPDPMMYGQMQDLGYNPDYNYVQDPNSFSQYPSIPDQGFNPQFTNYTNIPDQVFNAQYGNMPDQRVYPNYA